MQGIPILGLYPGKIADFWVLFLFDNKGQGEFFMIRGVNKNVIEISDTGNDCFDRAILFIRNEAREKGDLSAKAREYLSGLRLRRGFFRRGHGVLWAAIAAAAIMGGALTAGILLLF
jgi:hypothetical protein